MFTSKTPHFFKVILQETLTHGRLGIPRNFVRKYGNQLSSPVKLEVPYSSSELKDSKLKTQKNIDFQYSTKELRGEFRCSAKHDNGGVSGDWGCLKPDLLGKMQPLTPTEKQRAADIASWSSSRLALGSIVSRVKTRSLVSDAKRSCQQSARLPSCREFIDLTDSYIESLDDSPLDQKTKKKMTSPSFQPCKLRTNPSESNQAKGIKLEKEKKSLNFQYLTKEVGGELKCSVKNDSGRRSSARRRPKPDPVYGKQRACVGASAFRTSNPSFSVVIQPSYIGSSSALKANNGSMFASKTPHFFKIILEATIRDKKLGIPRKFVRKYGKGLSSSVLLTVPSGDTWHAQLTKSDGVVWFQNGWQAFAEYYSLQYGHFLVFRYEGNGKFLVLIFDMSASEIEYPCKSHIEDHNSDDQVCLKLVNKEAKDDTCDGTLYETPPCKETRKKKKKKRSRPPCSKPRKKLKTTQKDKNEKDWEDESTSEDDMQTKVPRDEHAFGVIEYDKALQRASSFRSENPFFLVIMQPSYINPGRKMCIPKEFTMKFLKENLGDLTLCTSEGKTWSTQYWRYISRNKYTKAIIHIGWRQFMLDNNLEAGDVCVFELISQTESMLKVIIYRVRQDTSCSSPLGGINSSENGGNVNSSTLGSTESNHDCLMRPMTPVEKARAILKASNFKSKNPFFKVVMQPRYLILRCSLGIPYKFVNRHLDEEKEEAILRVSDGRTWVVKFTVKVFTGGQHKAEFSTWRAFARDNNLEVGDVCVFELINRHENSFKVSIFSAAPGANSSLSPQADDAEASQVASKNCLVPRIEADDDFGNCYAGNSTDDAIASQVASKDWLVPKIEADDDFGKCHVGNSSSAAQFPAIGYQETEEEVQPTISTRPRGPQRLQAGEKAKALQRASGFKSQNPFFTVAMQPSYVSNGYRLAIPLDFSRKYLRNGSGNAILSMVGDGKTWLTKYHREAKGTNPRAKLIDGWKTFAKDNNLEIGDVCVFEMINSEGYQLSLNVAIYKPQEDQT